MHRFYAPALASDAAFELPEDEAHHLSRVLRLRAGDSIAVFDGQGNEALARVEFVGAGKVSVRAVEPRAAVPEARVAVTLAQALLKSDKMDRVIRDAVMLGVSAIQPFASGRTDVPLKAFLGGARRERWDRDAISSAKQCGRAVVPRVHAPRPFAEVLRSPCEVRLMFVEPGTGLDTAGMSSLEGRPPSTAMIVIGPEGGWDPQEVHDASAAGMQLVSFGARTLRADAAAAAVISVLRYLWRDM